MEIAGLVVGVSSLISVYLDTLERIEAYKEFGLESRHAIAQFEADKQRLKKWANEVGISDGKWKEMHDPWLKNHDLVAAVKGILNSACEIFDVTERTRFRLRTDAEENNEPFPDIPGFPMETIKNKKNPSSPMSIRGGLGWAFKRKGKFTNQVDMFRKVVDTLYNLVPLTAGFEPRLFREASSLVDHVNGIQPYLNLLLWLTYMRQMGRAKIEMGLQPSRKIHKFCLKIYDVWHGNKQRQRSMTGLT